MKNTIDEVEGLLAKATPGPWTREKPKHDGSGWPMGMAVAGTPGRQTIYARAESGSFPSADCDVIVALRNAAPDLIAVVRAAAKVAAHPRWERSEDHGLAEALARLGVKP